MPYDELLRLTGPTATQGNAIEAANITADAVGTNGYKSVGRYRRGQAHCRITGAFDRTTGDETITFTIREATDAAGTGAVAIASSAALTATHAANLGASTASGKAAGTLSDGPAVVGFATGAGGYIAVFLDVAGTTPIATGVAVDIQMESTGYLQSGR